MIEISNFSINSIGMHLPNLKIAKGSFTLISGANGIGKSSLCQILATGKANLNYQGDIIFSTPISVGWVMQNPDLQFICDEVDSELAFSLENLCYDSSNIAQRVKEVKQLLNLTGLENKKIHLMSGGEKQRVAIGAQIAHNPDLLIFDGADSHLDYYNFHCVKQALLALSKKGQTILVTTAKPHKWTDLFFDHHIHLKKREMEKSSIQLQNKRSDFQHSKVATLRNVSIGYKETPFLLQHIYLDIHPGEMIGIIGANGTGKSSLIRSFFDKKMVNYGELSLISNRVSYIAQDPNLQFFHDSVEKECAAVSKNILEDSDLAPFADYHPHALSFGYKHVLNFVLATANNPSLLLLDEPTAGLDPYYTSLIMNRCAAIKEMATLIITHDLSEIHPWLHRVFKIQNHRLTEIKSRSSENLSMDISASGSTNP